MEKFVVGTLTKSEIEADGRDLHAESVLPVPTVEELANLPKEFHGEALLGSTYYQNGWGACTAMGTVHSMMIQNIKELSIQNPEIEKEISEKINAGINPIEMDWKDLWVKMGHDLNDKTDSGDYVEKALLTTNKQGIKGRDWNGNDVIFFGLNYADSRNYSSDILKYRITKHPVIIVISGNKSIRTEMIKGEVTTIVDRADSSSAHCITISGYDSYGIIVANSWTPNDKTKKRCLFKISRENVEKMAKVGMLNWRYRIEFDKKDSILDLDLYIEENNAIEILKLLQKFYGKTRFSDVKVACGVLGRAIRREYKRANLSCPMK